MIKLPDAITADGAPEVDKIYMAVDGMGLKGSYAAYAAGFNAAIEKVQRLNATAQPVSDGWVKCSERMPENSDAVLVCQEGGITFCAEYDGGEFYPDEFPNLPKQGKEITHWMPLPAAPGGQDV
ncbi:DUF551 domain-containing protein [Pantoea ananatis]|uniref:DUF551 domain-containing protein n=1 Tax=Pantoea ananas TaxID=553 RepID=UPI00188FC845|nr:DUF551 domain-containing protein [Pantoea ananatis]